MKDRALSDGEELLQPHRELIDGKYHTVHSTSDGMVNIDTGPDDQLPDHDGVKFFRPTVIEWMIGESLYRHGRNCGSCGGELATLAKYCQHCGVGVAHYVFAMGTERRQLP